MGAPIVVKADGLAAGKGVVVAMTLDEALAAVDMMFEGGWARPARRSWSRSSWSARRPRSSRSATAITALALATAQDHKRVGDGDTGPEYRRHGRLFARPGHDAGHGGRGPWRDHQARRSRR
jgi:phosphoribosylamine--glycine ligase